MNFHAFPCTLAFKSAQVLNTLLRRSNNIRVVWSFLFEKTTMLDRHQGTHFQALCGVLAT